MPVCKDCGKSFGDGAFIYHKCKGNLQAAIDDCLANPAELRKEIAELKRQLEERTEQLRKEYLSAIDWAGKHQEAIEKLAESQAREARLRDGLLLEAQLWRVNVSKSEIKDQIDLLYPHDDTALKEYRDAVIDDCVATTNQVLDGLEDADNVADALRVMKGGA